jgi:hypothetical protein
MDGVWQDRRRESAYQLVFWVLALLVASQFYGPCAHREALRGRNSATQFQGK